MMRLAPTSHSNETASVGGLLLRLRAWFAGMAPAGRGAPCEPRDVVMGNVTSFDAISLGIGSSHAPVTAVSDQHASKGTLLAFPTHGAALLVGLAARLRARVADDAGQSVPEHDRFVLMLTRQPHVRLTIDSAAYVEFQSARATYYVVVETAPDTRITVETVDFDTVVKFLVEYVTDRLSDAVALEARL
jgi:hypothetical protein